MIKNKLFYFIVFITPMISYGQEEHYINSGLTSLTLKFSGLHPKEKPLSTPLLSNVLLADKPVNFVKVNDSTFFMTYYTFGPSLFYFLYNNEYCRSILLPNHSDIVNIHYTDSITYSMKYEGTFKETFYSSKKYGEMIREALFMGRFFKSKDSVAYNTANEYRDDMITQGQQMITELVDNIPSEINKKQFKYLMEQTTKLFYVFGKYNSRAYRKVATDKGTIKVPLERDISFYHGLNLSSHANIDQLINSPHLLFQKVRQDSVLQLPDITVSGPDLYLNRLKEVFDFEMGNSESLFYDIMIAGAYMDQVNIGTSLTEAQKYEVMKFFNNKQISNYIIYQNELIAKKSTKDTKQYYLSFDKENGSVFNDILDRYKGKVIVFDFWATWCGPCIEASGKIKSVKEKFQHEDVVFVYITNESSDRNRWVELADYIGGEHYFLYNNQSREINTEFSIQAIPSYLIFGKDGRLVEKSLGGYMGNDKLSEWIEKALKI